MRLFDRPYLDLPWKRIAFFCVCCLAILVRLHLTADRDILAGDQGADDLWYIRAAAEGPWHGSYWHMKAVHLPIYALWLQASAFLGIPARLAFDLLWCAGALILAWSFAKISRNWIAGAVIGLFLLFHPAGITLPDRALSENVLPPLVAIGLALGMEIWMARHGSATRRTLIGVAFALICAIAYHIRREGLVLITPLFLVGFFWLLPALRPAAWRRLAVSLFAGPTLAILLVGTSLAAMNQVTWGFFARCELLAPGYTAAMKALYRIKPAEPNPHYVTVTADTRRLAYSVSPTFAELKPIFEDQLVPEVSQFDYGVGTPRGEFPDGWFYWIMRDAAARAGWHRDARVAEAKYHAIACEIAAAIDRGEIADRTVLTAALSPEYGRWLPELPAASWRAMCMFFDLTGSGVHLSNRDHPENAVPADMSNYYQVAGRRHPPKRNEADISGEIQATDGTMVALGGDSPPQSWERLVTPVPGKTGTFYFQARYRGDSPATSLWLLEPAQAPIVIPIASLAEGRSTARPDGRGGIEIGRLSAHTLTYRADRHTPWITTVATALSWIALAGGLLAAIAIAAHRPLHTRQQIIVSLAMIGLAGLTLRFMLAGCIELAAWPMQYRYMLPALPFIALLLACLAMLASSACKTGKIFCLSLMSHLSKKTPSVPENDTSTHPPQGRFTALLILGTIGAIVVSLGASYRSLNWDDLGLVAHFTDIRETKGFCGGLATLLFGTDLGAGEYRLYGFSRITQFIISLTFKYSPYPYFVIPAILQVISGYCLFQLLMGFRAGFTVSILSAITWTVAPFAWSGSYHHYSYTLLPLQLSAFGAFFVQRWFTKPTKILHLFLFFIFCLLAIFSGEFHQPFLWLSLIAIALLGFNSLHRGHAIALTLTIAVLFVILLSHRITWGAMTDGTGAGSRFQSVNLIQNIPSGTALLTKNLAANIKWQVHDMAEGLILINPVVAFFILLFPVTALFHGRLHFRVEHDLGLVRRSILIFLGFVASAGLCLVIFIPLFSSGFFGPDCDVVYGFTTRYTIPFLCLLLVACSVGISGMANALCPNKTWIIAIALTAVLILAYMSQRIGVAPIIRDRESTIRTMLAKITSEKTKAILTANELSFDDNWRISPPNGATKGLSERIRIESSPLDSFWAMRNLITGAWGFPRSYCLAEPAKDSNMVTVIGLDGTAAFPSENIAVLAAGTGGSMPAGPWRVIGYPSFNEYASSPDGRPIKLFFGRIPKSHNSSLLLGISLGNTSQSQSIPVERDISYIDTTGGPGPGNVFRFGYDPSSSGGTWSADSSGFEPYYDNNRNGNFSYIIKRLYPFDKQAALLIDFYDRWHTPGNTRKFELLIRINGGPDIHYSIDLAKALGENHGAIGLPLWPGDQEIHLSFRHIDGDIPFANGIRIIQQ